MAKNFVTVLSDSEIEKLRSYLHDKDFQFREINHALFSAFNPATGGVSITVYDSKKLVVQGKDVETFRKVLSEKILTSNKIAGEKNQTAAWIGTDESGKGDYFGPLVVAGVYVDEKILPQLNQLNVRDSKGISDKVAEDMARAIKAICLYSVVLIGPEKYNALMEMMKNLNRLLAWGHARVIENLLAEVDCKKAITDQFGEEKFVLNALMEKGKTIELEQKPKAEDDTAVAAASILARAEFLRKLTELSAEVKVKLPKGASEAVQKTARSLVEKHGSAILGKVAKLHFKTTKNVLGSFDFPNK